MAALIRHVLIFTRKKIVFLFGFIYIPFCSMLCWHSNLLLKCDMNDLVLLEGILGFSPQLSIGRGEFWLLPVGAGRGEGPRKEETIPLFQQFKNILREMLSPNDVLPCYHELIACKLLTIWYHTGFADAHLWCPLGILTPETFILWFYLGHLYSFIHNCD